MPDYEMYEDAHLEAAYEDRFGFPDDGYDNWDLADDDWMEGEFEDDEPVCDLHGPGHTTASLACELKSQEIYYGTV